MNIIKRMAIAMGVAAAAFGARADDELPSYSLGSPPVTPICDTADMAQNAWLASNAVHVAMSSCSTNGTDAISSIDSGRLGEKPQYRLVSAEAGFSWERLKPEYYLGDQLDAPTNVNWVATYNRYYDLQEELAATTNALAGGFIFNTDETRPGVYVVEGGTHQFDWVLMDGQTNSLVYVLASVARGRPRRIYWTDYPYNGQKISLQGKFVQFYGSPDLVKPFFTNVTTVVGGNSMEQKNVITRGFYLDQSSMTLEARGQMSGQAVMVYYDSGNYDAILSVQVIEVCKPSVIVNSGVIGTPLRPNGRGYATDGLTARVTAGMGNMTDDRGDYLYQHAGQHSYSPKNGEVFPLRPTEGQRWKAEVTWMETDEMGVQWPFEIDQYNIDWPADISRYVRGDISGDLGADIVITNAYIAELQKYQEPNGHAQDVDASGHFRTVGAGKSLIKLSGNDDVWFLPIESVWRGDKGIYTLAASRVNVGDELELRSGTRAGVAAGARPFFVTDELPGYVYQAGTPAKNYDQNIYSETNSASAVYPVSTNGNIEVWWSERFQLGDMPASIAIPSLPQVYRPLWPQPHEAPQIVIASQQGSANETIHARYGAAYFDAMDARMALPNRNYFPTDSGTVMFWTRSDHYASDPAPATTNAPGRLITLANGTSGAITVEIAKGETSPIIRACVGEAKLERSLPANDAPNAWHHVAVAFGGEDGAALYFDGVDAARINLQDDSNALNTPADDLPEGYVAVAYIESTNGGGQYIDTEYVPKANTRIVADLNPLKKTANWETFFGAVESDNPQNGMLLRYRDNDQINGWFYTSKNGDWGEASISGYADRRITVELEAGNLTVYDGVTQKSAGIATKDGASYFNGSIYIFGVNAGYAPSEKPWRPHAMRLYSFQIYEGNSLERDFVPCVRMDDWAIGLYDRAHGKFYPNVGRGEFKTDWIPDNSIGSADNDHPAAVGREMAEVTFFDSRLTAKEIAEARYASRSGAEIGVTGYFSFRKGEDLVSAVQSSEGDLRTFRDRTGGEECVAVNVAFVAPGAPAKGGVVLQSDMDPAIYYQNDPDKLGYNPNDEHAFVSAGAGGYVVWALRSDLATDNTPPPGVFAEYTANGKNRLQFFHVVATNETWQTLSAPCTAGRVLPGPHPLDYFDDPWLTNDTWKATSGNRLAPAYRDRKQQIWARAAGQLDIGMYYAMQEGFYFPSLGTNEQPAVGTAIPWLSRHTSASADVLKGAPADWRWNIAWPTNCVTMKIGQTLTTAADGLPEVWNAKSVSVVYPVGFGGKDAAVGDIAASEVPVMLSDPTVMQSVTNLTAEAFKNTGLSIDPNGGLTYKGGKYHFTELPPSLSSRLYYDNSSQKLCFIGERVEKNAGATVLYPNVLSKAERTAVLNLVKPEAAGYAAWTNAVNALAKAPVEPNTLAPTNGNSEVTTTYKPADHYALTALGPTNYVVIIENDASEANMAKTITKTASGSSVTNSPACPVADGDPISMHVFCVTNLYYTGRIVTREDEVNLLSQQLSVLYTDPIGGKADDFEFEWRHAAPNPDGTIPDDYGDIQTYRVRPVNEGCGEIAGTTNTFGKGLTRFVIGQQGDTLANMVNTYWICRYRAMPDTSAYKVMGEKWSAWCAPPALAEGWVQRVLNNVTPFNQRMTDLYENKAETAVSMIQQAGGPFTGDVALNQDNLTSVGLIQLYETLLNKAESMSLLLGVNDAGANKQLLLAAERLGDLYKVLGDEAYSDAKNPTIGFGEDMEFMEQVEFASEASSLFCFDNQVSSLLDEELCLLRGRSGASAPTTRMGPYYNRLIWNFTKGITAGEVAYAVNYNVGGTETVALSEEQAARVYPQGHGDAYGHYLSALKGWYRLLRNPNFSWGRPAQGEMNLADSAVNVDYYEEAKFAEAAADLARTAADVVDLSARKAWRDNGKDGSGYLDSNITNAFGYGEWATRGGYGALVNWVTANSILPEDITLEAADFNDPATDKGLTRIDRGTVDELADICENANRIQAALDRLDAGLNPLGLSDSAVPFDISPNGASDGSNTHFEQVRDRAKTALANARKVLDRAQTQAKRMRMVAEAAENYAGVIASEEEDFNNQLITYYGTPYSDDIGPGKTYKQGYSGPDLIHYMWMDLEQYGLSKFENETVAQLKLSGATLMSKTAYDSIRQAINEMIASTNGIMEFEVSRSGFIKKPDDITGYRASPGTIQAKYGDVLLAYYDVTLALSGYKKAYSKYINVKNYTSACLGLQTAFKVLNEAYMATKAVFLNSSYMYNEILRCFEKDATALEATLSAIEHTSPSVVGAGLTVVTSPSSFVKAVTTQSKVAAETSFYVSKSALESGVAAEKLILEQSENALKMAETAFSYYKDYYSITEQFKDAALGLNSAYRTEIAAMQKLEVAVDALLLELGNAEAVIDKREAVRKRQVNQLSQFRYNEMLFRKFRDKSLTRYSAAFDLAQKYVFMAAQAYDYETALKREDEGSGDAFISKIVSTRSLGAFDADGEPMVADDGDLGLSGYLAQMDANWQVLKPRLGINNPQPYATWFSLRSELFRILDGEAGDAAWAKELDKHWTDDILADAEFRRYCQPFVSQFGLKAKEPGLVIPFETTIDFALNFFGNDLAGGDHAYDSSWYSTRIAAAGVWFDGYNQKTKDAVSSTKAQLTETPVVYLVPAGDDCLRAPGLEDGTYWRFSVVDQVIAAPYNIGSYELDSDRWMPSMNDADWEGGDATVKTRKHPSFRAYFGPTGGAPDDSKLDATRLIGRSVWNTRWLLVIPAGAMNADREKALSVFINGSDTNRDGKIDLSPVTDIKIGFKTYSQSGN